MDEPNNKEERLKKNTTQYIKNKYYGKMGSDEIVFERIKILKSRKIQSAILRETFNETFNKIKSSDLVVRQNRIKQFQIEKNNKNSKLSYFYQEKGLIRASMLEISKTILKSQEKKCQFFKTWHLIFEILKFSYKLSEKIKHLKKFKFQNFETFQFILIFFEKMKIDFPEKPKKKVSLTINVFSNCLKIKRILQAKNLKEESRKLISQFFLRIIVPARISRKINSTCKKCDLKRRANHWVHARIYSKVQRV